MKRVYWRPRKVSRTVLVLLAVLALGGFAALELFKIQVKQPFYKEKIRAARLTREAFQVIKEEHRKLGYEIDAEADPTQSGMIGLVMSEVTSNTGHLPAKQTSVNPNFGALVVHLLMRAGVEEGDLVGIGFSGSFPAINVAVLAACETLKVKPVAISSAAASQWGANIPELLWIDMERILKDKRLTSFRSVAASLGGTLDRGLGMSKRGRKLLAEAIESRNLLTFVQPKGFEESLERRMRIFNEYAEDRSYAAYINVGGGAISVGTRVGKKMFKPGLNRRPPRGGLEIDSVMMRFANQGVPVIHLTRIVQLAERYGLEVEPKTLPSVGEGTMYFKEEYNRWLAGAVLAALLLFLYLFIRTDVGFRLFQRSSQKGGDSQPEQMV